MNEPLLKDDADRNEAFDSIASNIASREAKQTPETTVEEIVTEAPAEVQSSLKPQEETNIEVEPTISDSNNREEEVAPPTELEKTIDAKTALDFLKDEDDEIVEAKPSAETEALKQRLLELEQLHEDAETKAAIKLAKDAKKAGKSFLDYAKEIAGEDVSKLSTRELFERKLNKYPELTEDERSYEIEKFDGMSKLEQLEKTSDIKNELANAQKDVLKRYAEDTNKEEAQFAETVQREANKAAQELEDMLSNKDYKNLELTPERKKAIRKYVNNNLQHDAQGKFDINRGVKQAIVELYEEEFLAANRNIAKAKAKQELFKEITRPSKETHGTNLPPSKNETEEFNKAQKDFWDYQTNKNNLTVN